MKMLTDLRHALLAAAVGLALPACGDDGTSGPSIVPLAAVLDGEAFMADAATAEFKLLDGGTRLVISGVQTNGDQSRRLGVEIVGWNGVGNYAIDSDPSLGFIVDQLPISSGPPTAPTSVRWETKTNDVGELIVTAFDAQRQRISGTFRFRAQNATGNIIVAENGSFTGTIQQ